MDGGQARAASSGRFNTQIDQPLAGDGLPDATGKTEVRGPLPNGLLNPTLVVAYLSSEQLPFVGHAVAVGVQLNFMAERCYATHFDSIHHVQ